VALDGSTAEGSGCSCSRTPLYPHLRGGLRGTPILAARFGLDVLTFSKETFTDKVLLKSGGQGWCPPLMRSSAEDSLVSGEGFGGGDAAGEEPDKAVAAEEAACASGRAPRSVPPPHLLAPPKRLGSSTDSFRCSEEAAESSAQ
jgi:hypothetical protein